MPIPIDMIRDTCTAIFREECSQCPKGHTCRETSKRACIAVLRCMDTDFAVMYGRLPHNTRRSKVGRSVLSMILDRYKEGTSG